MPTAAETIRDDLLGILGLESISHGPSGLEARIIADINRGLTHLYTQHPRAFLTEERRAEQIRAPVSATVAVTNGAKTITFSSPAYASWMGGCTLVIAGDSAQNMIVTDAGGSPSLLRPFQGLDNAAASATIYHDVIHPGADVEQVMAPVMLDDVGELMPLDHERARMWFDVDGTSHGACRLFPLPHSTRPIGEPRGYIVERHRVYSTGALTCRLRFTSLPDAASVITFKARLQAPSITALSDTSALVPAGMLDAVLKPVCRKMFSSWPHFAANGDAIDADYNNALDVLGRYNPQGYTPRFVESGGW